LYGGSAEYETLDSCGQGCLYADNNGLPNVLGCDIPVLNACYCRPDQLQIATSAISSCVNQECTNVDAADISAAIKVYVDYCNGAPATDTGATTAAESSTISK
jgi:CFEM domain